MLLEAGEKDDRAIATAAGLGNPKRLFFIKQELQHTTATQLANTLPHIIISRTQSQAWWRTDFHSANPRDRVMSIV